MLELEKNFYKILGYLLRGNIFIRRALIKFIPENKIRSLNIEIVLKLNTGEKFKVFTKHWIGYRCYLTGSYDIERYEEFHMLNIALKNNFKVFFDVGANHGYYSLKMSSILGDTSRIFAFEPFGKNIEILTDNIQLNVFNNISIVKKVVSEKNGLIDIYYSGDENPGATSCVAVSKNNLSEKVESITLDSFVNMEKINVDLLKIDVEGFELNVLQGMKIILREQKPLLFIEHNTETLASNNVTIKDIVSFMKSYDYEAYDISSKKIVPYDMNDRNLVLFCYKEFTNKILDIK